MFSSLFRRRAFDLTEELIEIPPEERSLASFIDGVIRAHGRHKEAAFVRWGDKTPLNSFYLSKIVNVFPDAKFIHLIRDPVDVLHSYLKHDIADDLDSAVARWRGSIESVREFEATSDAVLEIRYEEFVSDPESSIQSVCDFLDMQLDITKIDERSHRKEISDIKGHDHLENVPRPISTEHIGKGRRQMDADMLRRLQTRINPDCRELGYDPITEDLIRANV